jgi:hypothetical protein
MKNIKLGMVFSFGLGLRRYRIINGISARSAYSPAGFLKGIGTPF